MPTKAPAYHHPVGRVGISPPDLPDSSTVYSGSGRSGGTFSERGSSYAESHSSRDYGSRYGSGIDVMDELSDRMDRAFDPITMDRSIARQAQT